MDRIPISLLLPDFGLSFDVVLGADAGRDVTLLVCGGDGRTDAATTAGRLGINAATLARRTSAAYNRNIEQLSRLSVYATEALLAAFRKRQKQCGT